MPVLNGREISIDLIENSASRHRIAFGGASITTVSKLYHLGQQSMDWILADLSTSLSQYSASLRKGRRRWDMSTTNQQEHHAYDLYILLWECCLDGTTEGPVRFLSSAQRQLWQDTWMVQDSKECLEFLAIADECLRRPWAERFTGPLASRRLDRTTDAYHQPRYSGHRFLDTLILAVQKHGTWSGTFFIASTGHLGIGPESTQPGDQIVVLDGARSPFVLRALKNSADYALLGDSFVLGLMHGEVRDLYARGQMHSSKFVIQ
jgi:hypothetical protein